jgi:hypothetical protein
MAPRGTSWPEIHDGPIHERKKFDMAECEQEVSADLLSVILPAAARRAIGAYEIFSSISPDGGDAKEFGAFQNACKAAVTHLTALYQLQRLVVAASAPKAGSESVPVSGEGEYAEIYARARAKIALLDGPDPLDED